MPESSSSIFLDSCPDEFLTLSSSHTSLSVLNFHNRYDGDVVYIVFFFFFQAEDGIRDADVTGVQTCALPIFALVFVVSTTSSDDRGIHRKTPAGARLPPPSPTGGTIRYILSATLAMPSPCLN